MRSKAIILAACILAGCGHKSAVSTSGSETVYTDAESGASQVQAVSYTVANRYFVKNDAGTLPSAKIESQAVFDRYFGMATVMGKDGLPTPIDFSRQFVIAVTLPETDLATTLTAKGLERRSNGDLVFSYRIKRGERRSYTTKPLLMVIVDKRFNGNVVLRPKK